MQTSSKAAHSLSGQYLHFREIFLKKIYLFISLLSKFVYIFSSKYQVKNVLDQTFILFFKFQNYYTSSETLYTYSNYYVFKWS